jgi:peptidyl-prolyl cis-trans isomerase C
MRKSYLLGLLMLLLLVTAGCTSTQNGQAYMDETADDPADDSPPAFTLDDKTVTVQDYEERLNESVGQGIAQLIAQGQTPEEIREIAEQQDIRQTIFDNMIQEELLIREARREGLGVDPEEVDERVDQATSPGAGVANQEAAVDEDEVDDLREDITRQMLVQQVYLNHIRADMFNSKHILVEDEATAEEVVEKLEEGEDFAELASEYSQDPGSAESGGEYGWVARGNFVPEYEEAAFNAELNEPVIVESEFGYHVIVVENREEDRPYESWEALNSSRSAQQHYEETFVPWYENLREEAIESGALEINEDFDPNEVPLPIPDMPEMPEGTPGEAPAMPDTAPEGGTDGGDTQAEPEATPES